MKITKIEINYVKSIKEYSIKIIGIAKSRFGTEKETLLISLWSEIKPQVAGD